MTEPSVPKVEVKNMTVTERRELRRIVSRRFRMLREQLGRRESELRYALQKQVREERASAVAAIEKQAKPLIDRQNKLSEAWDALYEEARAVGVEIQLPTAEKLDLARYRASYSREPIRAITGPEAQERLDAIKDEAGWTRLNLHELEWQLDETLAVGELESGASREFLEGLPTVESLLPLPEGIELPAIES